MNIGPFHEISDLISVHSKHTALIQHQIHLIITLMLFYYYVVFWFSLKTDPYFYSKWRVAVPLNKRRKTNK